MKKIPAIDIKQIENTTTSLAVDEGLSYRKVELNDEAYVFFSSGSTGTPKVISIPHEGIYDRIHCAIERMEVKVSETVLNFTGFDFDPSLMEIFMALWTGAALCIVPERVRSNLSLPEFFEKLKIESQKKQFQMPSHAILVPSVLKQFKPKDISCLKNLLITGENCDKAWLEVWFENGHRIFNGYGPTETTFGATMTEIYRDQSITVNKPMKGIELFLVSHKENSTETYPPYKEWIRVNSNFFLQLEHYGEKEIYIGGNGIGKYIGKAAEANQQNFIKHDNKIYFRTNDIAGVKSENIKEKEIIFLGRNNRCLKYHGK